MLCSRHGFEFGVGPRPVERAVAEDVEPVPVEAVPIARGEPELIAHGLAEYVAVGVVPPECERIVGVGPGVPDGIDGIEETHLLLLEDGGRLWLELADETFADA